MKTGLMLVLVLLQTQPTFHIHFMMLLLLILLLLLLLLHLHVMSAIVARITPRMIVSGGAVVSVVMVIGAN